MTQALTRKEATALDEYEAVIDRGLKTFAEVGNALLAIRDARLYRDEYGTFEGYCKERWGFSANRARRLIGAAEVAGNLKSVPIGTMPATESQARPLSKLPPEQQPEAWQAATDKAASEGRKVTARDVETEVETRVTKSTEVKQEKMRPIGPPCVGMQFARIAIMNLNQIETDDAERGQAFDAVKDWISKNES